MLRQDVVSRNNPRAGLNAKSGPTLNVRSLFFVPMILQRHALMVRQAFLNFLHPRMRRVRFSCFDGIDQVVLRVSNIHQPEGRDDCVQVREDFYLLFGKRSFPMVALQERGQDDFLLFSGELPGIDHMVLEQAAKHLHRNACRVFNVRVFPAGLTLF